MDARLARPRRHRTVLKVSHSALLEFRRRERILAVMDTHLDIHLTEHAFEMLSKQAAAAGKTPAELAASAVEQVYSAALPLSADPAVARANFERCFGTVDMGRPVGIANPAIDADLARQYGNVNGTT